MRGPARANQHWKSIGADRLVLLVVTGAAAYSSPTWYDSKAEHGKVVPTWNYSVVHLSGRATVHDDLDWTRGAVDERVNRHEGQG